MCLEIIKFIFQQDNRKIYRDLFIQMHVYSRIYGFNCYKQLIYPSVPYVLPVVKITIKSCYFLSSILFRNLNDNITK